jgi:hypothetical protein
MLRDTNVDDEKIALLEMVDACVDKLDEAMKQLINKAAREI